MLEDVMILTCKSFGIPTHGRVESKRGIWYGDKKVGSVGVSVKRWVTSHGWAMNVSPDLGYFGHITACNIEDVEMTSLEEIVGVAPAIREVQQSAVQAFGEVFKTPMKPLPPHLLHQLQDL
eukprot:TRINITY_DN9075_c0_g1_i1.p2 TRINITY_DN9075_c0_g1~~TRINITY_DN9075_c0_g1_i1.p2  ORF type:complete len:121 (+),score=29.41 TRINITY_DN9075_c0_g1_i1:497-859(+)